MRLRAPAKINLHLRVGPVEADGFHPLSSWMVTVGLFDSLTLEPRDDKAIEFSCDQPRLPTDDRNLVVRAAKMLRDAFPRTSGVETGGATVRLEKSIPSAAGLGGGSSDAARTLLGLGALWKLKRTPRQLAPLAAKLGSDVPFFLFGPSSICSGRGENVRPIARPAVRFAVLIFPGIEMSTARVYETFDRRAAAKADAVNEEPGYKEWASFSADALLPRLINDLEDAAFELSPALGRLRADTEQYLGRIVRMSGSGSTLFTLVDDEKSAQQAVERIKKQGTRAAAFEIAPKIRDELEDSLDSA
jgi:4-diphosphocytidyl-2-C-methyl-D-erythritol kinase